jgi:hypothetical protein
MTAQNISPVVKRLLLLFIVSLFVSLCKNEMILSIFPKEYVQIARVSSISSSFITNSISILILFITIISLWYFSIILNLRVEKTVFIEAAINFVTSFFFSEAMKFFLIWIFLKDELVQFSSSNLNMSDQLLSTDFFKFASYTNLMFVGISTFILSYYLVLNKTPVRSVALVSGLLFLILTLNSLS